MRVFPLRSLLAPGLLGFGLLSGFAGVVLAQAPQASSAPAAVTPPPARTDAPAAGAAQAATVAGRDLVWYTAEVPVASQESRERDAALGRALAQVLVRVTGRADAPADPVLQRALRTAASLSMASEYREDEEIVGGV